MPDDLEGCVARHSCVEPAGDLCTRGRRGRRKVQLRRRLAGGRGRREDRGDEARGYRGSDGVARVVEEAQVLNVDEGQGAVFGARQTDDRLVEHLRRHRRIESDANPGAGRGRAGRAPQEGDLRAGVGGSNGCMGAPVALAGARSKADCPVAGSLESRTTRRPPQLRKPWSAQTTPGPAMLGSHARTPPAAQSAGSGAVTPIRNWPAGSGVSPALSMAAGLSASDRSARARLGESAGSLAGNRRNTVQAVVGDPGAIAGMAGTENSTAPSPTPPGVPTGVPSAT